MDFRFSLRSETRNVLKLDWSYIVGKVVAELQLHLYVHSTPARFFAFEPALGVFACNASIAGNFTIPVRIAGRQREHDTLEDILGLDTGRSV